MNYEACHDHDEFVTLTNTEIDYAILRSKEKYQQDGQSDRDGWEGWDRENNGHRQAFRNQALGGVCEQAVAKALNLYPLHEANKAFALDGDLPYGVEVKLIGRDYYGLRIYDRTPDELAVVGIVIEEGKERGHPYRIPGWIRAGEGKSEEWTMAPHGRPPFYAVPQMLLWPLDELRAELGQKLMTISHLRLERA